MSKERQLLEDVIADLKVRLDDVDRRTSKIEVAFEQNGPRDQNAGTAQRVNFNPDHYVDVDGHGYLKNVTLDDLAGTGDRNVLADDDGKLKIGGATGTALSYTTLTGTFDKTGNVNIAHGISDHEKIRFVQIFVELNTGA